MTLIWHIWRKDLHLSRIYWASALAMLLGCGWTQFRIYAGTVDNLHLLQGFQLPADILLQTVWALLCGVLVLAEALPGEKQYWLVRPIRSMHLLAAKFLLIACVIALPLFLVHVALVASRGFSLLENTAPLLWNAILTSIACTLPVAVLASVSRNLQQYILWILAVAASAITSKQFLTGFPDELRWVTNSVTIVTAITGSLAILIWQYSTRRTNLARVAAVALCVLLFSFEYWPVTVW